MSGPVTSRGSSPTTVPLIGSEPPANTVLAAPTKSFFVTMLTRDLDLAPAIMDLVDNCLDGAKRLGRTDSFDGLYAKLSFDEDHFKIWDNCGGIEEDIGRRYAFCFGKPSDEDQLEKISIDGSVGLFGIGMKRALFKLGRRFVVESVTTESAYRVEVHVPTWLRSGAWTFPMKDIPRPKGRAVRGTTIIVTDLYPPVADELGSKAFGTAIATRIREKHADALSKGFGFSVNTAPADSPIGELYESGRSRPAVSRFSLPGESGSRVRVRLVVGVGPSSPRYGGWYVYCNGRQVLGSDQSAVTGWGAPGLLPRYHNQYAMFRGFVFMDAPHATDLPWNTSKTGLDESASLWSEVRERMATAAEPVKRFLDKLKVVTEAEGGHPRQEIEQSATARPFEMSQPQKFGPPTIVSTPKTTPGNLWIR